VIPTQPPPPLPFSPADQILFDVYGNFTAGVAKALAVSGSSVTGQWISCSFRILDGMISG